MNGGFIMSFNLSDNIMRFNLDRLISSIFSSTSKCNTSGIIEVYEISAFLYRGTRANSVDVVGKKIHQVDSQSRKKVTFLSVKRTKKEFPRASGIYPSFSP